MLASGENDGAGRPCVPDGYRYRYVTVRYDAYPAARTPWSMTEFIATHAHD